jgi:hypothetical protein
MTSSRRKEVRDASCKTADASATEGTLAASRAERDIRADTEEEYAAVARAAWPCSPNPPMRTGRRAIASDVGDNVPPRREENVVRTKESNSAATAEVAVGWWVRR